MLNPKVKNQDCMQFMAEFPDNYFQLCIADPPYGININHSIGRREGQKTSGHKKALWDSKPPTKEVFDEIFRVSANQIIWGANYFISEFALNASCWLLWDKKYSFDVTFAQFEMAWTSFNSSCKKIELTNSGKGKIHPTEKPVRLYKWLLTHYAKQGDKIFDPFLGSGSSRIAAHDLGFDFYATELDKDYFEAQEKRFAEHIQQPQLFEAEISAPKQDLLFAENFL